MNCERPGSDLFLEPSNRLPAKKLHWEQMLRVPGRSDVSHAMLLLNNSRAPSLKNAQLWCTQNARYDTVLVALMHNYHVHMSDLMNAKRTRCVSSMWYVGILTDREELSGLYQSICSTHSPAELRLVDKTVISFLRRLWYYVPGIYNFNRLPGTLSTWNVHTR